MSSCILLFPHQLFEQHAVLEQDAPIYLVEEHLFFKQYPFHQQKLAFHRATMKAYADKLKARGKEVQYIETMEDVADVRKLLPYLQGEGVECIHYIDPTDNYLQKRIQGGGEKLGMELIRYESGLFLNTLEELKTFFKPSKKKFFQTSFYKAERKRRDILMDEEGQPAGGKWTYDSDNRKKYPRKKQAPPMYQPKSSAYYEEAKTYVQQHFSHHYGQLSSEAIYPITHIEARVALRHFLDYRFAEFGPYEDAIVDKEVFLNHSVMSPLINVGLISADELLEGILEYASASAIPLNSTEGYVRQLIGWREFMRGMYEVKGTEQRNGNYWEFKRKIPKSFYDGTTGIRPVDDAIKKVLKTGYCHHIERLMVLGNFMLLCEFDPNEVYQWFMELFIDAYDWVMVPNVYGMSQFADGGLLSTKPYISGSNYIVKMSNYSKTEDWTSIWDALFWRFMHLRRDFFLKNPRLSMLVRSFDKMDSQKQQQLLQQAEQYLERL